MKRSGDMEKIKNKTGQVISYREKVFVDGKAITKTFKRKSDASAWKQDFSAEIRRKKALGLAHIESIDFESFAKLWTEMREGQGWAKSTLNGHRAAIRMYLSPVLGRVKLENIHLGLTQKIIQRCRDNGIQIARMNNVLILLKQMLKDAVRFHYLIRNPLEEMKKIKRPPRSLNYWMPEQVHKFLKINRDSPYCPLYALALNTGMRIGELLGLCWDKINLVERRIEIARIRNADGFRETTKTGVIRYIPLNDAAFKILSNLAQEKRHETFVFTNRRGRPISASFVADEHFKRSIEKAEVPKIRFHDLRTTYASNFVMAGGDIFALSKLLGHSKVEMTAKKYAALHPNFMKEVVQTVQFEV